MSTGSTNLTIPPSAAGGVYYLLAKADGTDAVAGCNETNNSHTAVMQERMENTSI